jgi:AcrR family transcriptional regulator
MDMTEEQADHVRRKDAYHHGDLRGALVHATRQLVIEMGAENFTLADACKLAGVSTAAPYRHFRDKQEILEEVVSQGFDELAERSKAAVVANGPGTLEGIVAMGQAYVRFAVEETAIFRLMFGQNPALKKADRVMGQGRACFGNVIGQVELYCDTHGLAADAQVIALELWTFVHGAASLLIDEDYEKVAPGLDVDKLILEASPRFLGLLTKRG